MMSAAFMNNEMNPELELKETKIEGEVIHKGIFFDVQRDTVRLSNERISQREYIKHPGAVVVLPVFDDGSVLLERQYRYPLDQVFIEFPAGKIEIGEDPFLCAQRELEEETGYTASDWQFICIIHNAIAYSDECLYLYLARGLTAGEKKLDDDELLQVFSATMPELMDGVREGKITDVKTVIGAFWLDKFAAGLWDIPAKKNIPVKK